jgi:hypothetical protein
MFTAQTKLSDLDVLTTVQQQALKEIEETYWHPNTSKEQKDQIIQWILAFPIKTVYALSRNSQKFKDLCEQNDFLMDSWISILQRKQYLHAIGRSFDKTEKASVFNQLKGAVLVSEMRKSSNLNLSLLNEGCQLEMYDALMMRLNVYDKKLADIDLNKTHFDEIETLLRSIFIDANTVSNLYWSVGFLNSGIILLNIVDCLFASKDIQSLVKIFLLPAKTSSFSWFSKYEDKQRPFPITVLETALENIYTGLLIANMPQSKAISNQLVSVNKIFSIIGEDINSFDDVQQYLIESLKSLDIPLVESFCENAFNHSIKAIIKLYPDCDLPDSLENLTKMQVTM